MIWQEAAEAEAVAVRDIEVAEEAVQRHITEVGEAEVAHLFQAEELPEDMEVVTDRVAMDITTDHIIILHRITDRIRVRITEGHTEEVVPVVVHWPRW